MLIHRALNKINVIKHFFLLWQIKSNTIFKFHMKTKLLNKEL